MVTQKLRGRGRARWFCSQRCYDRWKFIHNAPKLLAYRRAWTAAWTPERRKRDNEYKRTYYAKMSPEKKAQKFKVQDARAKRNRASETPEQRQQRLTRPRARAAAMTDEQRAERNAKCRAYYQRRKDREGAFWRAAYASKSPEKRAKGIAWRGQWRRAKISAESAEQRELRLMREREQKRAWRQRRKNAPTSSGGSSAQPVRAGAGR